jgi:hypothetical protein
VPLSTRRSADCRIPRLSRGDDIVVVSSRVHLSRPIPRNDFDLESPASLARWPEPDTALRPLTGLVVIDEIQRRPVLFPLLLAGDRITQ